MSLPNNQQQASHRVHQPGGQTALQMIRQMVSAAGYDGDAMIHRDRNAEAIRIACVWEATAPKVGNVHPDKAFADCDFDDFCSAASCISPILAGCDNPGDPIREVGDRVLRAITATGQVTSANVNLGIVLLVAPLCVARDRSDVSRVLAELNETDCALVYQAIALASPGGVKPEDVDSAWDASGRQPRPASGQALDLIAAMRMARDRDRIALQYASDFTDFFENVIPVVAAELAIPIDLRQAIVRSQIRLMAAQPDSLIARKCGAAIASEAMQRAAACYDTVGTWNTAAIEALDDWLRADGNRRNPGTTADLIAAALYWLIR